MELAEIQQLQQLLCVTSNVPLEQILEQNTAVYTHKKKETVPQFMLPAYSSVTHGFVLCCLDSLEALAGTCPTPSDFILSVSHQNTLTQVLQLVVGFGVEVWCDAGVCPTASVKQVERYIDCAVECNLMLEQTIVILQKLANDSFYGSLVISRYLGVLLAMCIQILHGPNNPCRTIKQNNDPGKVSRSELINTAHIHSFLDVLLHKTHVSSVVKELVSLQLPKEGCRSPRWLLAVTNDLLSNQVIRPNGVMNVTRALFEQYDNVLAYEDQGFCDKISEVIVTPPRHRTEDYMSNIAEQVGQILNLHNRTLKKQYLRLYKNLVHKLSVKVPDQTYTLIWCNLFKCCVLWSRNEDTSTRRVLMSEPELEDAITTLENISGFGLFQGCLSDRLCENHLYPLLQLYHHLHQSVSHLKRAVCDVIKELMMSSESWQDALFLFLTCDLSAVRSVTWEHGGSGGVELVCGGDQPQVRVTMDPDDILGTDDKIVEVIVIVLKTLSSSDQLSDFFLRLFKDITSNLEPVTQEDTFLGIGIEFRHFQRSLRKGMLIDQLCQTFGQKLLKNTAQTIELLKSIILQKSENPGSVRDELLLVSFGIVSTYLREDVELSESDEREIRVLVGPLLKIAESSEVVDVADMANDLRICIATKINLGTIGSYHQADGESDVSLCDIMRDLGDPLLPSRAHAIIQLGKKFEKREAEVTQNVEKLLDVVLDNISHNDSYVFLAAVKCLAQMSWHNTRHILDVIIKEIQTPSRKADDRAKCMEVLVNIMRITSEMLPSYEEVIFGCLLSCITRQEHEILRVSSLSCIAELCTLCKHGTLNHIQEILHISELTLVEDESILAKKAALFLISRILETQKKDVFYEMESDILRIYRLLKRVSSSSSSLQNQALLTLGVLSGIVRDFMFPKTQIRHEIKIL